MNIETSILPDTINSEQFTNDIAIDKDYFARKQIEMLNKMNPNYIETVSMPELYEMVYTGKAPIIDGLLYPGTYLFVGSPKVDKSFMMVYFVTVDIFILWNIFVALHALFMPGNMQKAPTGNER